MTILAILPLLLGDFVQKWVNPDGKNSYGRIVVGDVDHDGLTDIFDKQRYYFIFIILCTIPPSTLMK